MAQAMSGRERQAREHPLGAASDSDPEPDVTIREAVGILYRARKILDSIRANKPEERALRDALYRADAELGYAAWQVGVLKGQLRRERRAKAEIERRLAAHAEPLRAQGSGDNA
jgi:hypothetical protein